MLSVFVKMKMYMQNVHGWTQIIFQMINVNREIGLQYWSQASDFILCLEKWTAEYLLLLKKLKTWWNKLNIAGSKSSCNSSVKIRLFCLLFPNRLTQRPQGIPVPDVFILPAFHPSVLRTAQIKNRTPIMRYLNRKYKHILHQRAWAIQSQISLKYSCWSYLPHSYH